MQPEHGAWSLEYNFQDQWGEAREEIYFPELIGTEASRQIIRDEFSFPHQGAQTAQRCLINQSRRSTKRRETEIEISERRESAPRGRRNEMFAFR